VVFVLVIVTAPRDSTLGAEYNFVYKSNAAGPLPAKQVHMDAFPRVDNSNECARRGQVSYVPLLVPG